MTPNERLQNLLSGKSVDRPPFFPALYDYKAGLAGVPPHLFGQDEGEIIRALSAEAEELQAEALTSAYDIYNVEAEALGAKVLRREGLPMPEIEGPILSSLTEIDKLPALKAPAGRMPLFIAAAAAVCEKYGASVPVRVGVSGPFSLASKLFPREELLMEVLADPGGVRKLLDRCTAAIETYLLGFIGKGIGAAVFDSFIAPPMLSPAAYEELVLPFHRRLFSLMKEKGVGLRPLIAGGNTIPLLPALTKTGANQLLLDYSIPPDKMVEALRRYPGTLFRINIAPAAMMDPGRAVKETKKLLSAIKPFNNVIIGTGILPPETPRESIRAAREEIVRHGKKVL